MTVLAVTHRSTGDALLRREIEPVAERWRHTVLVYGKATDLSFEATLYGFDLAFGTKRDWVGAMADLGVVDIPEEQPLAAGKSSAVEVIESLARVLGVPVKDILTAARVRKRTFHHWKSHPATRPRLESQGDLWSLAHSVEVLVERHGEHLPKWVAESPVRRAMLRRGAHRDLVREATTPATRPDARLISREHQLAAGYFDDDESSEAPLPQERAQPTRARAAEVSRARHS